MICFPNAKINLGLHIVSERPYGYHNIETVFYPIPLCDVLEIVPSGTGKTAFSQTGIPVGGSPGDNLVMRAFHLLKNDFDLPEIAVYLRKRIPFGAGLGGGSSDAAFMLKLLNDFAGLGLSAGQMEEYAGRLGADCPFFIRNKPVFAEGVGDIFSPVNISLKGYYLVLVKPDIHVLTKEAYAGVTPGQPLSRLTEMIRLPLEEWKNHIVNDFEEGIFARYPTIGAIKQSLYNQGAIYAAMSGSGSSVFGIFERHTDILFPDKNVFCVILQII
ncbi:MAG: 4-(cytidine 5'-diphospho)-2-C-methyl-D-erythritol kinase [Dysgonamonadaceae bacterium]|jgi:4-diphosphocytidyl-2-C-methyl-D-erythritol kinase|nr:4-(cytidine 5'-diphospho)-2-C-methyl-D-erythritol kinase [Dysgonamonadaceae bacterium]